MSLTSLIRVRPDISDFLVSRIKEIPSMPRLKSGVIPKTHNHTRIGTAFDYVFRFEILRRYPFAKEGKWVAEEGIERIVLSPYPFIKKWEMPAIRTLEATRKIRQEYFSNPTNKNLRKMIGMCFRLAQLDLVVRDFWLPSGPVPDDGLMPGPDRQDVLDVVAMLEKSKIFIDSAIFSESSLIELNPTFGHYSTIVGGADADIITSNSLIDLKTSSHPSIDKNELAQIAGYFMLMEMNYTNPLQAPVDQITKFPSVKQIGMFYPRFGIEYMISTEMILFTQEDMLTFSRLLRNPPEVREDPLQKLRRVGYSRSKKLREMGISKIEELAQILTVKGSDVIIAGISLGRLASIARDYLDHTIELRKGVERDEAMEQFDFDDEVYLDIETTGLSTDSQIWLIGMFFKKIDKLELLFTHGPEEEKSILKKYLETVSKVKGNIVTFSGHYFDSDFIEERLKLYRLWKNSPKPDYVDLLNVIRDTVLIPVSNNLKDMAAWMGYNFKHPDLSGALMPQLYMEYLFTQDDGLLKRLLEYNEDDIRSLVHIVDFLKKALLIEAK